MKRWERGVPVFGVPILTPAFFWMCVLAVIAVVLTLYRTVVGLAKVTAMTDAYAWGIWKSFNVMVLTGLGSGAFAVGIAANIFNRHKLHSVMRVALLTSFLAYSTGLLMLGVDVGRPWNFYWAALPWKWNLHSPLLEVAICISIYTAVALFLENVPPVLEYLFYEKPQTRTWVTKLDSLFERFFPIVMGLAYILPMMHQSSLGALMLLGGNRVHPLWQSSWLPLIYVWAAAYLGYACVSIAVMLSKLAWNRGLDLDVLDELNKIMAGLIIAWTVFRFGDIIYRGVLGTAFQPNFFAVLFWVETALTLGPAIAMLSAERRRSLKVAFLANVFVALGGMIYRFSPTTLAFRPKAAAFYFPSINELLISFGYIALAIAVFMLAVKKLAILPDSNEGWMRMAEYEKKQNPEVQLTGYSAAATAGHD